MKVGRLPSLHIGRPYPPENIPVALFCLKLCQHQGHSVAESIMLVTPSGIEAATCRLVAQCLKQLRHRVPQK